MLRQLTICIGDKYTLKHKYLYNPSNLCIPQIRISTVQNLATYVASLQAYITLFKSKFKRKVDIISYFRFQITVHTCTVATTWHEDDIAKVADELHS